MNSFPESFATLLYSFNAINTRISNPTNVQRFDCWDLQSKITMSRPTEIRLDPTILLNRAIHCIQRGAHCKSTMVSQKWGTRLNTSNNDECLRSLKQKDGSTRSNKWGLLRSRVFLYMVLSQSNHRGDFHCSDDSQCMPLSKSKTIITIIRWR